jgi:glycosyltransferase involved in cell wall biosynthesis
MGTPAISVIIPFYNAERVLSLCLRGIANQSVQPLEVILVDNNSQDSSGVIAKQFVADHRGRWSYLVEPKQGPSPARNTGARNAKGEIIAFTDSDCIPDEHWLRNILQPFNKPFIGAVAGRIKGARLTNSIEIFHALFTLRGGRQEKIYESFSLNAGGFATANFAVKRNLFENLGGFDESRAYGEDHDLCARIYRSGHCITYAPSAVVSHLHRSDIRSTCRQAFRFGESHPFLLSKHFERYLLIELGDISLRTARLPLRVWVNLSSADKKVAGIVALSMLYPPFLLLMPAYFGFLMYKVGIMARAESIDIRAKKRMVIPLLLIAKSAAMTAGRLWGSFKNRAFCL